MRYTNTELQQKLAAEYVMGNMTALVRRRFERLRETYPDIERHVLAWNNSLHPLNQNLKPVPVPDSVWQRIESRLGHRGTPSKTWLSAVASVVIAVSVFVFFQFGTKHYSVTISDKQHSVEWMVNTDSSVKQLIIATVNPPKLPANKRCVLWVHLDDGTSRALTELSDQIGVAELKVPHSLRGQLKTAMLSVSVEDKAKAHQFYTQPSQNVVFSGKWQID